MKLGAGAIVIAVGLVILWLAVTGKLGNIEAAWRALTNTMSDDLRSDLEKAKRATPPTVLPPLGAVTGPGERAAAMFNVPLPFPTLPSFN